MIYFPLLAPDSVWPDWAYYWTLGNFLKSLATINLTKSPTFKGNFCSPSFFLVKSFLGNFIDIWRVFLVTLLMSPFHFIFSGPSVLLSIFLSLLLFYVVTTTQLLLYYSVLYFLFLHIFFASCKYFFIFTFSKKLTFSFSFLLTLSTTWLHKNIFVCFLFSNISFNSHNYLFFTAFSMSLSLCIVAVFLSFFASPLGLSSWLCRHISDDDGERYLVNVAMTKPS